MFIQIKSGNTNGIINNYREGISIDVTPKSTDTEIKNIVKAEMQCEETDIIQNRLIIYPLENNNYTLAHEYTVNGATKQDRIIIKDDTKEVLEKIIPIYYFEESYMESFLVNNEYVMVDNTRNISIYAANDPEMWNFNTDEMQLYTWTTLEEAEANEKVVEAVENVQKCYDYFKGTFNYVSLDGQGEQPIRIITGLRTAGGKYRGNNAAYHPPMFIVLGEENLYNDQIDVLGHEYTHAVLQSRAQLDADSSMETSALIEAYCDIIGMCVEAHYENGTVDGVMSEEVSGHARNIKDSKNKYKELEGKTEFDEDEDAYYFSTILSRAAYEMSENLTLDEFEKLWFNSMKLLPQDASFYDCEYAVMKTAERMNLSADKQDEIRKAFDRVGLINYDEITKNIKDYSDKKWEKEIADRKPEETNEINLNDELEGVYAFANKEDGNGNKNIVAILKENNSELQIINTGTIAYDCLDYSYGKLYLQKGTEFYSIDLTKGNGNYTIESIYKVSSDSEWYEKRMQVHDGVLYFNKGGQQLVSYNLTTKKEEVIASTASKGNTIDFRVDKENGIIYYCKSVARDGIAIFGTYDIATKENKEILTEDRLEGKGYDLLIGNLTDNGIIVYKFSNYSATLGYEYNRTTGELKFIDEDMAWNRAFYDNGKLYYSVSKSEELLTKYTLRVYDNGNIKDIFTLTEESIDKIYSLNDTELQVITSGGQDISTYYTKTYLVNKLSLGYVKGNTTYDNMAYIAEGSDKHTEVNVEVTNEPVATKEDLVGKWRVTNTNSTEYSPGMLFGSSISMANSLEFKADGTYSLGVGFAYAEDGNYEIQGDTIKLTNIKDKTDNPDIASQRGTEAELKIKKVDGSWQVILEYKQDEYKNGQVAETLIIDVIFEKL